MGRWIGPDNVDQLLKLCEELDPLGQVVRPVDFINAVQRTGLLTRKSYYVPDPDELLGLMKTMQYHLHRGGVGCRWVMCRETVDALAAKWVRKVTPAPLRFDAAFWRSDGADLPPAALEMEVLNVIEHNRHWPDQTRLFGWPVRVDPGARSPMFEIDTEATETRPLHVVKDWTPDA